MKSIFLIILTSVIFDAYGQKNLQDTSIQILGFQTKEFYAGEFNSLSVISEIEPIDKLTITCSQGILDNVDSGIVNGFLSLTNLKAGFVTISVFKSVDNKLLLLNSKKFPVKVKRYAFDSTGPSVKPILTLDGHILDNIPLAVIKKVSSFSISKPYRLVSITAVGMSPRKVTDGLWVIGNLTSPYFTKDFKSRWNFLHEGCWVNLDDIEIAYPSGKIVKLRPINFKVIK